MDAIVQMINPPEVNSADTPSSLPLKPEMKLPQNVKTIPSNQIFTIVLFFIHQSIVTIVTIVNWQNDQIFDRMGTGRLS